MRASAHGLRVGVLLALVWTTTASAQQPAQAPPEAQRVVAVRIVTESGELLQENPPQIPVQPGSAFDSENVRESLRQLYRTGRFADVRAEAVDAPGGVRLDFVVRQNIFIDRVRVTGIREPPSEGVTLAALRLGLGQTFRESLLEEALTRLRETLAEEGLYQPQIECELERVTPTHQINILVRVTPGPRARVGKLEVRNLTSFSDEELLRRSKLKAGQQVRSGRLERAADRVRKFLVKKGYLSARVGVRRGDHDAQANTVPLALEVSASARVQATVTGVKISSGDLRKLLPIYQEGAVDEDLLQEGRRNIRDFLERDGYFDAQVRYEVGDGGGNSGDSSGNNGQQVINYIVDRGPRSRLVDIGFEGNRYFTNELLRGQVRALPATLFSRGRFSRRLLRDDEDSLLGLYVANGFLEAKVSGELIQDYGGKGGDLFVRFHIEEGPQTLVAELTVTGNRVLSEDELLGVLTTTACQPYSDFNAAGDRDNVLATYFNEGFPGARFEWTADDVAEAGETLRKCPQARQGGDFRAVRLKYEIVEGEQVTVEKVLLSGQEFTRSSVIEREVQIQPGEPLREGEVIETQRRLYNLGIFSRVSIAPQNPGGTDTSKTVVVQVEETKRYTIAYGGGFEVQRAGGSSTDPAGRGVRAAPRALFEITRANFAGRAHTVGFKVRASSLQSRALLTYIAPNFLPKPGLNLLLTGLADRTRDVRTFTSTRYEATTQLEQRISPSTSFLYRYSFRRVLVDPDSLRVSNDQIPLFSQPTKISSLGISWIRERRDNSADASRGNFNTVDLSVAARRLGSSASFFRFFMQNSSFHPLGRRGIVFARSTRFGFEEPLGKTTPDNIPLPERFFAGGGNSLRGFALNQAGPRDAGTGPTDPGTGFPVGGLALLTFNHELRFPMRLPFVRAELGGAVFFDAGNVFTRANRITLRGTPKSPAELNYFSHTIGFGIRYATPIGPVRLDLGYLLNPAKFCAPAATPDPRCPGGGGTSRVPRFQVFFNIGSIF
jgi:outer membrane protein assembly complex protein YaeT